MHEIDWKRLAKPQEDGYDVDVLNMLDAERIGWRKVIPRSPVTLCDGAVGVVAPPANIGMGEGDRPAGDVTQEWADKQTTYLTKWTAGYVGLRRYLDEFWPWRSETGGYGCSSGHHVPDRQFPARAIYVTINDLEGCAQGIYHEYAHLRLRSMGIQMETCDKRLLTNEDHERFDSPVRFDVKRPMPAVVQGLYAWLLFVENDYQIHESGLSTADDFNCYTLHNLPKIENGLNEVRRYARFTAEGRDFFDGLFEWGDDLLNRCHEKAKATLPIEEYQRRCSSARI